MESETASVFRTSYIATAVFIVGVSSAFAIIAATRGCRDGRSDGAREPAVPKAVISSEEAADPANVGRHLTVSGQVVQVKAVRTRTFLNFDRRFPNQSFTVVVPNRLALQLDAPKPPYTCVVVGTIKLYEGRPEIEIDSLDALRITPDG